MTNYEPIDNEQIRMKYSSEVAEKFIQQSNEIDILSKMYNSDKFSIDICQKLYITKRKGEGISIDYDKGFNQYVLNLIIDFYDIKNEPKYSYKHTIGNQESFTYSQQFLEFILREMKRNSSCFVESLRQ